MFSLTIYERKVLFCVAAVLLAGALLKACSYHPVSAVQPEPSLSIPEKIDINEAGEDELILIPQIGKKTAQAIIDYRRRHGPFTGIEQLEKVKGIGPKKILIIQEYIKF